MSELLVLVAPHRREVDSLLGRHSVSLVSEAFLSRLARAGATPLIAWPGDRPSAAALGFVRGALLVGGGDVSPSRFDSEEEHVEGLDEVRDEFEIELVDMCRRRRLPLLGMCRGAQVLNVALGGSLRPVDGHRQEEELSRSSHAVTIEPESTLAGLLGGPDLKVNSFHRWAVERAGEGLRAVATSLDGVVEGIESEDDWWCVGVQWHAEFLDEPHAQALFDGFAAALEGGRT
jgi:putative glutamine amidotransferase